MIAITSDAVEFRGSEDMHFKKEEGGEMLMTCIRFDDENGVQSQFYVADPRELEGFATLKRGALYNLKLSIGAKNKVKLLGVFEA